MYQGTSAAFNAAIKGSHAPIFKIDIAHDGAVIASTASGLLRVLPENASVSVDRNAAIRRKLTATFIDSAENFSIVPMRSGGQFIEWFNPLMDFEFRPYRGMIFADKTYELVPLGVFYLSSVEIKSDKGSFALLDVECADRGSIISRNKWTTPWNIAAGTNQGDAIAAIIRDRARGFTPVMNIYHTTVVTPDINYSADDDPWEMCMKLAEGMGCDCYWGLTGELIVQPIPDSATQPMVASYDCGPQGVFITSPNRKLDRATATNGVIVRSSAPWLIYPVEGSAWDDDPLSITYRGGPMGEVPVIIDDATVTNEVDASAAAFAKFHKLAGIIEDIQFNVMVDPRIDVGDVIGVDSAAVGVEGKYVLETLTVPLTVQDPMAGSTKRRRAEPGVRAVATVPTEPNSVTPVADPWHYDFAYLGDFSWALSYSWGGYYGM